MVVMLVPTLAGAAEHTSNTSRALRSRTLSSHTLAAGVPGVPTYVQATGSVGSATVSWTAPPQGAAPIEQYTITASPSCFSCHGLKVKPTSIGSPPHTTTTATGLSNPAEYTFAVSAQNSYGSGVASEPSSIAVVSSSIGAPSAPRDVVASPRDGHILVSFNPPANDGGYPITGYKVDATPLRASVPSALSASPKCLISFQGHCLLYMPAPNSSPTPNGAWSLQYEGAPDSFIVHMACPSASECIGVGATMSTSASSVISYAPYAVATYDAGASWHELSFPAANGMLLTSVSCATSSSCVAGAIPQGLSLSATPQLFYTSDAGVTWAKAAVPSGFQTLQGISCVAATTTCFGVGLQGVISSEVIESTDSGASWTKTPGTPPFGFTSAFVPTITGNAISCATTSTCTFVGVRAELSLTSIGFAPASVTTYDAGATWSESILGPVVSPASLQIPTGISCPTASSCTAIGYDYFGSSGSVAWNTTNAASTWSELNPAAGLGQGAKAFLYAVSCPSSTTCYTAGFSTSGSSLFSPVILGSSDSGAIWNKESVPSKGYSVLMLASVSCATDNNCEAGGVIGSFSGLEAAAIGADWCGTTGTICNTGPQPTPGVQNSIEGAENGTTYQVSVTASNIYGSSLPGAAVYPATPIAVPHASTGTGIPPVVATLIGHANKNYPNQYSVYSNVGSPKLTLSYNSQSLLAPATGYKSRHVDRDCGQSSPVSVGTVSADLWVFCDTLTTDFTGSTSVKNHFTPSGTAAMQWPLPSSSTSPQPPNLTEDVMDPLALWPTGASCSSSGWPKNSQSTGQPTVNGLNITEGQPCPFLPSEGPHGTSTTAYQGTEVGTVITTAELMNSGQAPAYDPDNDSDNDASPYADNDKDLVSVRDYCIVSYNEYYAYYHPPIGSSRSKPAANSANCQSLQLANFPVSPAIISTNQYYCTRWTAGLATLPTTSGHLTNNVLDYYQHWCFPLMNRPHKSCPNGYCYLNTATSECTTTTTKGITTSNCSYVVFLIDNPNYALKDPGAHVTLKFNPVLSPSVGVAQVSVTGSTTNQPSSSYDNVFSFLYPPNTLCEVSCIFPSYHDNLLYPNGPQQLPCNYTTSGALISKCDLGQPESAQAGFASGAVLGPKSEHLYVYSPVGNWSHFVFVARINLQTAAACTPNGPSRPAWACAGNYKYYYPNKTWSSTPPSMANPPQPVYSIAPTPPFDLQLTAQEAPIAGGTFSVSRVLTPQGTKYVMVYQPVGGPYAGEMQLAYSSNPYGPFTPTSGVVIPGCSPQGLAASNGCYDYLLHPELDSSGNSSLVFSYMQDGTYSLPAGGIATGHVRFATVPMACVLSACINKGYWLAGSDGGVYALDAPFYGSLPSKHITPSAPIVGIASTPDGHGYWLASSDGSVYAFGVPFCGSLPPKDITSSAPIVGIAATPDGNGYWLVGSAGSVYAFGVPFYGSLPSEGITPSAPIVGIAATPGGNGYWLVGSDGRIFSFGDAQSFGSMAGRTLTKPIVGIASTPDGHGYWLVASDGGIFSFGDAKFYGSMGGRTISKPIVGMASTPDGYGYWEVASDGGIFSFGDAKFYGSMAGRTISKPIVGVAVATGEPS